MNSIDKKWLESSRYKKALFDWDHRTTISGEVFEESQEFRDARLAFRRDVNQSWGMEST